MRHAGWKLGTALFVGVLAFSSCASSETSDELGVVDVASITNVLPVCPDLPSPNDIDEFDFEVRTTAAFNLLGGENGLQSAGAHAEGFVGLEFVDPPSEGFDEVLAQLPDGFCIESIRFTPAPPAVLDVIDETGQVSELPASVNVVNISFAPDVGQPTSEETGLTLWLVERECASGQEMGDRLLGPEIHEGEDEILIAAGSAVQLTVQDCPGNPPTEVTVILDAPVGDRDIRNALTGDLITLPE